MDMIQEAAHIASDLARRTSARQQAPREFLTFRLGAEEYGIDILVVQEIRSYETPTRIANSPHFVKGVVNLRGVIVPIVDLRLSLHCDRADYDEFTVVIVLNVAGRTVGVVVDSVSEVVGLTGEQIQPAPTMPTSFEDGVIVGISSAMDRMIILIDIVALLGGAAMGLVDHDVAQF